MKKGEKIIAVLIALLVVVAVGREIFRSKPVDHAGEIPFYTTANDELKLRASDLYKDLKCRDCHRLWGVNNIMQFVPAPSLDGIGSLRDEEWLYTYFSAENPQTLLKSRLKPEYRMPSYANLPEENRRILAKYFASLKVKDWYLDEVKRMEQEKLTGKSSSHE